MENSIEEKAKAYWNSFDLIKYDDPMALFAHGAIYGHTTCLEDVVKVIEGARSLEPIDDMDAGWNSALRYLLTKLKNQ